MEPGFLSQLKGQFGVHYTGAQRTVTLIDEEIEEEQDDEDELNRELVCSQPLTPRSLNF